MFSTIAAPLHKLIKINAKFEWTQESEEAFQTLKQKLQCALILRRPDYNLPFTIYTDASNVGVGGVLTQTVDNMEHVIAYCSRTLNKAEKNYSATERECLAVVYAIKEFRPYVYGTSFTVVTGHQALTWLAKLDDTNPRLARWILLSSEYDFNILYRPGKANKNADGQSRLPQPSKEDEQEDEICTFTYMINVQFKTEFSNKTINLIFSSPSCVLGAIRRSTRIKTKPEKYGEYIPSDYIFSYNHPRVIENDNSHQNSVPSRRDDMMEVKQPRRRTARHSNKSSSKVEVELKHADPPPDPVVCQPLHEPHLISEEAKRPMVTNPHCEPAQDDDGNAELSSPPRHSAFTQTSGVGPSYEKEEHDSVYEHTCSYSNDNCIKQTNEDNLVSLA